MSLTADPAAIEYEGNVGEQPVTIASLFNLSLDIDINIISGFDMLVLVRIGT